MSEFISERQRLTQKEEKPSEKQIEDFIGEQSIKRLIKFESMLEKCYEVNKDMRFPFGNNYGWAYKYSHKKTYLLYVFFEEGAFCCTLSLNDKSAQKVEENLNSFLPLTKKHWENRYPCGKLGGWIDYTVTEDNQLDDILALVNYKVKPKKV